MSDTKALCEVVSAALDNHGNGKAQDAFETLRGRLERVEADNAALVAWVNENGHRIGDRLCPYTGGYACEPGCMAHSIHTQPHPGAALLEELEGLRTENKRLRQERNYWEGRAALTAAEVAQSVVREPIAIRVEGIPEPLRAIIERDAHNAALEEAAKVADGEPDWIVGKSIARRIRALKKTGQGA